MDTAARIGITFCLMTGALFFLCLACILREHRRGKSGAKIPEIPEAAALQVVPATRLLRI